MKPAGKGGCSGPPIDSRSGCSSGSSDGQQGRGGRHGLRRAHHRRLLRPPRPRGDLRRHRRRARSSGCSRGEIPIFEPGLEELVGEGIASGRLTLHRSTPSRPPARPAFVYLCVPTPQGDDGSADLTYLEAAARQIGPHLAARDHRRQQVHRAGRLGPTSSSRSSAAATSTSSPTPSSCARARRSTTSCNPDRVVIGADDQSAAIRVAGALPRPARPADGHRPGLGRDHQVRLATPSSP